MFEIEKVDMEHIDRIKPLWEKLIQANAANSPYFADYYGTFEFEIRKGFLQEKLDNGAAMYTAVLVDREKKQDASQARSEQRRAAVAEFSHRLPYRQALLLDRAASHVPLSVTLTSLAVQPLSKTLEEGKDPVFVSETLSIRGVTNDASAVSELITGLRSEPLLREARLEGLEQNRESGATEFKITVAL